MELLQVEPQNLATKPHRMHSITTKLRPKLIFYTTSSSPQHLKSLCTATKSLLTLNNSTTTTTTTAATNDQQLLIHDEPITQKISVRARVKVREPDTTAAARYKENWLASLSCPFVGTTSAECGGVDEGDTIPITSRNVAGEEFVIGIDPDLSGALALLKTGADGRVTAQVFDSPHLQVMVGKRVRRRLDTNSIVKLLQSFDAPVGTIAYLEQSTPFPQDGKQGWWSGGFGYGLWIGVLVASGFSVVPVPSCTWKNEFELTGKQTNKDDSRRLASTLFPSTSSLLKRKKDHGRAEALLIAAYGKGMKIKSKPENAFTAERLPAERPVVRSFLKS